MYVKSVIRRSVINLIFQLIVSQSRADPKNGREKVSRFWSTFANKSILIVKLTWVVFILFHLFQVCLSRSRNVSHKIANRVIQNL